jgi:hypothetical protein
MYLCGVKEKQQKWFFSHWAYIEAPLYQRFSGGLIFKAN